MSGDPCHDWTLPPSTLMVSPGLGSNSHQAVSLHLPVGSMTSPLLTTLESPSFVSNVLWFQFSTCRVIAMSLIPSLRSEMLTFSDSASSATSGKEESLYVSMTVPSLICISGVSRNFLTDAPTIFTRAPSSCSNSFHDRKPILPEESEILPLTTFNSPLPSLLTITSGFAEMTLATMFTKPSTSDALAIVMGSLFVGGLEPPPSFSTVTLVVLLIFRDFLSFHSFTEAPSSLTIEPGTIASPLFPQSL